MRKGPYLTEEHKMERLNWCLQHQNVDFSRHIFVDETMVRVFQVPTHHSRRPCSRPVAFSETDKFRAKVNVWGGISYRGATKF